MCVFRRRKRKKPMSPQLPAVAGSFVTISHAESFLFLWKVNTGYIWLWYVHSVHIEHKRVLLLFLLNQTDNEKKKKGAFDETVSKLSQSYLTGRVLEMYDDDETFKVTNGNNCARSLITWSWYYVNLSVCCYVCILPNDVCCRCWMSLSEKKEQTSVRMIKVVNNLWENMAENKQYSTEQEGLSIPQRCWNVFCFLFPRWIITFPIRWINRQTDRQTQNSITLHEILCMKGQLSEIHGFWENIVDLYLYCFKNKWNIYLAKQDFQDFQEKTNKKQTVVYPRCVWTTNKTRPRTLSAFDPHN